MWQEIKQVRNLLSNLIKAFYWKICSTLCFTSCCLLTDKLIIVLYSFYKATCRSFLYFLFLCFVNLLFSIMTIINTGESLWTSLSQNIASLKNCTSWTLIINFSCLLFILRNRCGCCNYGFTIAEIFMDIIFTNRELKITLEKLIANLCMISSEASM